MTICRAISIQMSGLRIWVVLRRCLFLRARLLVGIASGVGRLAGVTSSRRRSTLEIGELLHPC